MARHRAVILRGKSGWQTPTPRAADDPRRVLIIGPTGKGHSNSVRSAPSVRPWQPLIYSSL